MEEFKGRRITLTKTQADSPVGRELISRILDICHDGEITEAEINELHLFLVKNDPGITAFAYLRAITRGMVADGVVDSLEIYSLKKAFIRTVTKDIRGVVQTHLEAIGTPPKPPKRHAPAWTRHAASAAQIEYIAGLGGEFVPGMTKGEASELIDSLLERRPPTPRQKMLIRFFDRLELLDKTKSDVSEWIDQLYWNDRANEDAWERFKADTGLDWTEQDASVVPIGAFRKYKISREPVQYKRPKNQKSGCLGVIAVFITVIPVMMAVLFVC